MYEDTVGMFQSDLCDIIGYVLWNSCVKRNQHWSSFQPFFSFGQGDLFYICRLGFPTRSNTYKRFVSSLKNYDIQNMIFVCLFGLMLYLHGQQLRSCRDGQLSYPHCSWASLPEAGNQYLAHILSPSTDNCSS